MDPIKICITNIGESVQNCYVNKQALSKYIIIIVNITIGLPTQHYTS